MASRVLMIDCPHYFEKIKRDGETRVDQTQHVQLIKQVPIVVRNGIVRYEVRRSSLEFLQLRNTEFLNIDGEILSDGHLNKMKADFAVLILDTLAQIVVDKVAIRTKEACLPQTTRLFVFLIGNNMNSLPLQWGREIEYIRTLFTNFLSINIELTANPLFSLSAYINDLKHIALFPSVPLPATVKRRKN